MAAEFAQFVERMPVERAGWKRASPFDVLTFEQDWLPRHHGRDGEEVSPGYLQNVEGYLSHAFARRGACGTDNPGASLPIATWHNALKRKST